MAKKSKRELTIDFSEEVEGSGRRGLRKFNGKAPVRIEKVSTGESEEKGTPFIQLDFVVTDGKMEGRAANERFYLTPKSLSRIRMVLEALGVKVPKKKMKIPVEKLKGGELVFEFEVDEDSEKEYSRVSFDGIFPMSEWKASKNGDGKKKGKKGKKSKDVDDIDLDEL